MSLPPLLDPPTAGSLRAFLERGSAEADVFVCHLSAPDKEQSVTYEYAA